MTKQSKSFSPNEGLQRAIELLHQTPELTENLPEKFPDFGRGEDETLNLLAPYVLGRATRLDSPISFAHMDPPTPWITWAMSLWNARLNQNLLHSASAPFAVEAEKKVIDWLTPFYGMDGGHMCSGSTIANITALWAAREVRGVKKVVASRSAHFSIAKAASLLGLSYEQISTDVRGRLNLNEIEDTSDACLVLTAGTTDTGAIDPLALVGKAKWTHVDAAWAGPLRLSLTHAYLLDGITGADSIAVSAHKWLFQPKDSSLIMFRDTELANSGISFGGSYLAAPNVGLQGSRGAAAVPLLATMVALGRAGIVGLVDHSMSLATKLATELNQEGYVRLWAMPETGVTLFQPTKFDTQDFYERLPKGMFSTCVIDEEMWVRSVAANPLADIDKIIEIVRKTATHL